MKQQRGYTLVELVLVFVYCIALPAGIFGWGWNVYKIINSDFGQITGLLVVRCIGIFVPPLGAIVGYF